MKNKSLKVGSLIACICLVAGFPSTQSVEAADLKIGGTYLGGINSFRQYNGSKAGKRNQFDFATNLDFEWKISDRITGLAQLQMSPGDGSLKNPGPGSALTDVSIEYSNPDHQAVITLGSFDTPFGQQVSYLSNNADTTNNSLLMNSLFYSSLTESAPLATLNTLGVKVDKQMGLADITLAVTNGTDESATNTDSSFETVLRVTSSKLISDASLGASFIHVNDKSDVAANSTGFKTNLSGWMVDAHFEAFGHKVKSYYGLLTYGDNNSATEDDVIVWMIEKRKDFSDLLFMSARISGWHPQNSDGNGSGISSTIPNAGLAMDMPGTTIVKDQTITRFQLGLGYNIEKNVVFKTEVFLDDYARKTNGENTNVIGLLAFINASF